jgi:spore coat polysaccharide biosynthesis protein SpsF
MPGTIAIVQARMTSTRLPGKVLADLCGKPLLAYMLDRIRRAKQLDRIVVATTANASDDAIVELCDSLKVESFRGDETDVLSRYHGAARQADAEVVVRLTSDCPMHDPTVIDEGIALYRSAKPDYASNVVLRTYPDGLDVEVFSMSALEKANREADHPFLREHVTPYINGLRGDLPHGDFRLAHFTFGADFSHLRWTVDTARDLERVRGYCGDLPENFTWLQAVALATRHPDLLA